MPSSSQSESYDVRAVKAGLPFLDLMNHEGVVLRRSGANWVGRCPFHEERSSSFTVHAEGGFDHGHCYGCGWNGDVLKFWMERHGVDFPTALGECARLGRVAPERREQWRARAMAGAGREEVRGQKSEVREKPALPRMRMLTEGECGQLARLRGLSVESVMYAASIKRVGACLWPQFQGGDGKGPWEVARNASLCWCVTDDARWCAQFRRFDGGKFTRADGRGIKAWTKGSPTWPIGAGDVAGRPGVLLVEGGPDMLAGFHFLLMFRSLAKATVVAMLGASMKMAPDVLALMRGKRVRIVVHDDDYRPVPNRPDLPPVSPGWAAALRWQEQLREAGAAVEALQLRGLWQRRAMGPFCRHRKAVKDLNDLAFVEEEAWLDGELREAFTVWDF